LLIIIDDGEGWYVVKGDVTISGKVLVTLCHRTDVDVKPVITEVKPDGVIHYYTRYFDNPAFSYWEFYDDGK